MKVETWTWGKQSVDAILAQEIKNAQECLSHTIDNQLFGNYKRYRRGKNRCNRCGFKINPIQTPEQPQSIAKSMPAEGEAPIEPIFTLKPKK